MKDQPYSMVPGGALRIRNYDESGVPERVTVSAAVARRAQFVREQYVPDDEGGEHACAVFKDERTGRHLAQLVEPEPEEAAG